jgi:hypothetical protein
MSLKECDTFPFDFNWFSTKIGCFGVELYCVYACSTHTREVLAFFPSVLASRAKNKYPAAYGWCNGDAKIRRKISK